MERDEKAIITTPAGLTVTAIVTEDAKKELSISKAIAFMPSSKLLVS